MVFSSYEFVLGFLPIAVLGYLFFDNQFGRQAGLLFLLAASYLFYAWGEKSYLAVLIGFTALNYFAGRITQVLLGNKSPWAKWWTGGSIAANLAILGYFKYSGFIIRSADQVFDLNLDDPRIALPLGISFFAFHALSYTIDAYKEHYVERNVVHFALFLSFFPHMVAGPILRPKEFLPQINEPLRCRLNHVTFARGLTMFVIGLFKKCCLADSIAPFANATFSAAASGQTLTVLDGWGGVLAYTDLF
jgi:D-alanyl-lipoteichoic acid acyltransferase DltB (MBOAT superfamily)